MAKWVGCRGAGCSAVSSKSKPGSFSCLAKHNIDISTASPVSVSAKKKTPFFLLPSFSSFLRFSVNSNSCLRTPESALSGDKDQKIKKIRILEDVYLPVPENWKCLLTCQ